MRAQTGRRTFCCCCCFDRARSVPWLKASSGWWCSNAWLMMVVIEEDMIPFTVLLTVFVVTCTQGV